jgi:hypothetical protein
MNGYSHHVVMHNCNTVVVTPCLSVMLLCTIVTTPQLLDTLLWFVYVSPQFVIDQLSSPQSVINQLPSEIESSHSRLHLSLALRHPVPSVSVPALMTCCSVVCLVPALLWVCPGHYSLVHWCCLVTASENEQVFLSCAVTRS